MKVVLDTNVLIAAFATQGLCHAVLEVCIDQHEIVLSEQILEEIMSNLERKLKVPSGVAESAVQFLRDHSLIHEAGKLHQRVARDPKDDHVLSLAAGQKADYIITGDQDLLVLRKYKKAQIVLPRDFWEILRGKKM